MKTRTDLINYYITKHKYTKYLEIGVCNPSRNFNHINVKYKIGIDPDENTNPSIILTSDEYFKLTNDKFDIIFIDGLHIKEQVINDILNSLKCLRKNGTIVLHDCNPIDELSQKVPKEQEHWNGNVWEAFVYMRTKYDGLNCFVIDMDEGCGVIQRDKKCRRIKIDKEINYANLAKYKMQWLNLMSVNKFLRENENG